MATFEDGMCTNATLPTEIVKVFVKKKKSELFITEVVVFVVLLPLKLN